MGRDRSLEEFLGGESGDSTASDAETEAGERDPTDPEDAGAKADSDPTAGVTDGADADAEGHDATVPDDVEPPTVTYRWDPDGIQCADCGATVDRLWSGEAGRVCTDCKEW